jgi:hypothetical protein
MRLSTTRSHGNELVQGTYRYVQRYLMARATLDLREWKKHINKLYIREINRRLRQIEQVVDRHDWMDDKWTYELFDERIN